MGSDRMGIMGLGHGGSTISACSRRPQNARFTLAPRSTSETRRGNTPVISVSATSCHAAPVPADRELTPNSNSVPTFPYGGNLTSWSYNRSIGELGDKHLGRDPDPFGARKHTGRR
jgi:hypothetical protein